MSQNGKIICDKPEKQIYNSKVNGIEHYHFFCVFINSEKEEKKSVSDYVQCNHVKWEREQNKHRNRTSIFSKDSFVKRDWKKYGKEIVKHSHKIRLSKFNTMIEELRSWEKKDEIHTHTHDISILQ